MYRKLIHPISKVTNPGHISWHHDDTWKESWSWILLRSRISIERLRHEWNSPEGYLMLKDSVDYMMYEDNGAAKKNKNCSFVAKVTTCVLYLHQSYERRKKMWIYISPDWSNVWFYSTFNHGALKDNTLRVYPCYAIMGRVLWRVRSPLLPNARQWFWDE